MGADEEGTLAHLKSLRKALIDPKIAEHRGHIFKTTGDGMLVEFASAVDAARCAVEIQRSMAEQNADAAQDNRIKFRIGIHVGDIIIDDNDIFGDGVNIAARLEGIAEPGGVCISDDAHRQIRGKVDILFEDMGSQTLKNIAEPMRVWRMRTSSETVSAFPHSAAFGPLQSRPFSDKPSIAVLPFQNMSGDPEQEYFADGIAEDVLTTLSKIQELTVIARYSSFVFKGQTRDVREIGRILGARYVLEGSVRKVGNRVRLTAQLIDSLDGSHLWADRFDGGLDDVFDLQDRITQDIVAALEVRLTFGEQARVWRKRSGSPLVYEYFLKGQSLYVNFDRHTHAQARDQLAQALEINPVFTPALYLLGLTLTDQARFGWEKDRAATYEAAMQRLSPIGLNVSMVDEARARFHLGDFTAARDTALRVMKEKPRWLTAQAILVAALWNLGSEDDARVIVRELLVRHPDFSVSRWARGLPYRRQEDLDTLLNPLRRAGLPE